MNLQTPACRWISGGATDTGKTRKINQDAYLDRPDLGLWAVADGMGGHRDGGMASRLLVDRLGQLAHPQLLGAAAETVSRIIEDTNRHLVDEAARQGGEIIGSTIVAVMAVGDHCAILWAGDSRAYRLRKGDLTQLTLDHTQVQEMVEQGLLTRAQADLHPLSNVLVRAVGGDVELKVDRRVEALLDGDRYLLCSDGLLKEVTEDRIARMLDQPDPRETAQSLVQAACDAGGRDNVTVVVMDYRCA
ncbi:PP2C family protein-serine/threonine phosphatase [Thiocystis violascens]|uniref:Serine/threonine protein phosphatase n=1 Tax=Thiocystis violascens (strain ATCC 17096 / DSM 198 / 6111) TaxID=765911 RepID=I3YB83_THIV6|nr:protein phosphatase 2C domain-containing protein [Thiocystis violascens]AFL74251.1 serine/threonine protein phosphatase [Thiocystis violascens DSM 198]